ncbi:chemotaxis regulatory protein ChePep [Helicobacter pylori]|uniref:chemotaxis regulatory protein ChePep n=1 Tax=Helicobacter pylori TaxID=210 RepID=UPI002927B93A|nr:chemotaxis regulatory protein ChePep [Helicobacter pylori]MDU9702605.1 chemotaxis regulatory protein ChePep [Helicobacter pylori]
MKMILFNQNPMIAKLLESVSKKLELPMENFNHYQELSARLKKDPEWLLIADDECLEKLDQVDWLELKETISQNKNSVCMYKKGNEAQPFLEGFEMKIKKPFLPTEMLKVLQKKLGSDMSELEPSQNLDPTQEVLETNWDDLENLGDLEALAKEEPNNEEQLLPTLNTQEEAQEKEIKEEKQEVKETPQEEKPKDDETQEGETPKDEEVSKELETQEELEIPKEETQEETQEEVKEEIKEETQENKEEKQEETQDSPSVQELEAMQELVKEIQENSNGQEDKKEKQENAEIPQDKEIQEVITEKTQAQELEVPKEKTQESAEALQETQVHELEKQEIAETPQDVEVPQSQEKETPQEETQEVQETQEKETPQTQDEKPQEDHYESIEDIPEPVMAKAMGEELPFLNEAVAKTPNNENDTEISKNENDTKTPKESVIKTPQEKEGSDKTSNPLELHLNLQDLLKSLNQESLKSLLENKTLSIKITLEDKKPNA